MEIIAGNAGQGQDKLILPLPSVINEKILSPLFSFLSPDDLLTMRLVCQKWKQLAHSDSSSVQEPDPSTGFSALMQRMEILDKIYHFLSTREDRCSYRLVCRCFNAVGRYRTVFAPVLTDTTCQSILSMDYNATMNQISVEDLIVPLPVDPSGLLDAEFCKDLITKLNFYEGVSSTNKAILLQSFPNLQELKYIRCSTFEIPPYNDAFFLNLTCLHVQNLVQKDNADLETFFTRAYFPKLTSLNIELHFRRDLLLYMELYNFVGNHHSTLKLLQLDLKCFYYPEDLRENAGSMLVLLSNDLIQRFNKIVDKLKLLVLESLTTTFLDYEGTSMFHLGFTLLTAQKRLQNLKIIKEFTKTRRETLPLYNAIQKNEKTLEHLSIPHPYSFNCSSLSGCTNLRSLTVRRILDSSSIGSSIEALESLPTHKTFNTFRMGIRLNFVQIRWVIQHLYLTELEFIGHHGELFSLSVIQMILQCQPSLHRLEYECDMTLHEYKLMKMYFKYTAGISMEWSHLASFDEIFAEEGLRGEFHISIDRSLFQRSTT